MNDVLARKVIVDEFMEYPDRKMISNRMLIDAINVGIYDNVKLNSRKKGRQYYHRLSYFGKVFRCRTLGPIIDSDDFLEKRFSRINRKAHNKDSVYLSFVKGND